MRAALQTALKTLHRLIDDLDGALLTPEEAAELLKIFLEVERLGVSGKLLLAARAAEGTVWVRAGHRSAASWLAEVSGSGVGEAVGALTTADQLTQLPETSQALRRGELSAAQAREVAAAASADPSAEAAMLHAAATESIKELKEQGRKVRARAAAALSRAEREEMIRRGRYLRSWTDDDGAFRLDAKLTPVAGAQVLATLESQARVHFEHARASGVRESEAAYLADALVGLCSSDGVGPGGREDRLKGPRSLVHLRIDLAALRRGKLELGEICEIPGVGPVSLDVARSLLGDSFLKLFVTNGIDVQSLVHYGRTIPAPIRSALEERDRSCVVPGCGATRFLQIDHWQVDFSRGGATELWNLARLCPHHHQLKTRGEFELAGGPGQWEFRRVGRARRDAESSSGGDPPIAKRQPPAELALV